MERYNFKIAVFEVDILYASTLYLLNTYQLDQIRHFCHEINYFYLGNRNTH